MEYYDILIVVFVMKFFIFPEAAGFVLFASNAAIAFCISLQLGYVDTHEIALLRL